MTAGLGIAGLAAMGGVANSAYKRWKPQSYNDYWRDAEYQAAENNKQLPAALRSTNLRFGELQKEKPFAAFLRSKYPNDLARIEMTDALIKFDKELKSKPKDELDMAAEFLQYRRELANN